MYVFLAHFQKLKSLFDDIFEESDSFPANPTVEDVRSSKYFSNITKEGDHPLLSQNAIKKLTRYISRVQTSKRRPDGENVKWDVEVLRRVLKLMERSMRRAEGIEVFDEDRQLGNSGKGKARNEGGKGRTKAGKRSKSPTNTQDSKEEDSLKGDEPAPDDKVLQAGLSNLEVLRGSGLAAEFCLVLLDSEGLSKQVCKPVGF